MKEAIYSVSQVNQYIKNMFIREPILNHIYIKGEVSNCKYHTSGHIYFTLKDSKGQMACVMFAGQRSGLSFRMSEGQSVIVLGSINVYERDGKYQMYANEIRLDGTGILYERFEQLKRKLEAEGLFDSEHKKPIKAYNQRVGIVTASTGAAIQDIINIATRRNPYVQLILYPAKVQGEGAARTVVEGIQYLEQLGVDVIIVGRGGGSIEDLWAFNEEIVARSVFAARTPIISAVGHETDTTIVDFVSDLRAPTPSAAAELAVANYYEIEDYLQQCEYTLNRYMTGKLRTLRSELEKYSLRLKHQDPFYQIREKRQYLIETEERLTRSMKYKIEKKRHLLALYIEKMKGLSPLERLNQGFGYLTKEDGAFIGSIEEIAVGETISIAMKDGELKTRVEEKKRIRRE